MEKADAPEMPGLSSVFEATPPKRKVYFPQRQTFDHLILAVGEALFAR